MNKLSKDLIGKIFHFLRLTGDTRGLILTNKRMMQIYFETLSHSERFAMMFPYKNEVISCSGHYCGISMCKCHVCENWFCSQSIEYKVCDWCFLVVCDECNGVNDGEDNSWSYVLVEDELLCRSCNEKNEKNK